MCFISAGTAFERSGLERPVLVVSCTQTIENHGKPSDVIDTGLARLVPLQAGRTLNLIYF